MQTGTHADAPLQSLFQCGAGRPCAAPAPSIPAGSDTAIWARLNGKSVNCTDPSNNFVYRVFFFTYATQKTLNPTEFITGYYSRYDTSTSGGVSNFYYTGGTDCGGVGRNMTVAVACGAESSSCGEGSTCNYFMTYFTPLACSRACVGW